MLTDTEKNALKELKDAGYSFEEAMGFVASTRMNKESRVTRDLLPEQPEERVRDDIGEDLVSGFQGIVSDVKQRGENVGDTLYAAVKNKQTPMEGVVQLGGNLLGALGDVAGRAIGTGAKLFMKDSQEKSLADSFGQAVQATGIPEKYNELSPRTKRNIQGIAGLAEAGTLGVAGAATKPVVRGVARGIKTGIKQLDDAASLLTKEGITETGEAGIRQAAQGGNNFPESLMQRVARISKGKQTKFEERAGESVGQYLVSRGVFGTPDEIVDQLYKRMQESKSRVDNALNDVQGTFKNVQLKNAIDDLMKREADVGGLGRSSPDGQRIQELAKKHSFEGLTLSEVNELKRLYERHIRLNYVQEINTAGIERANRTDSALRKFVEDKAAERGVETIRELNRETMLARQLADDLGAEYAGQQGNNMISITDWIAVSSAPGNPVAAAALMATKRGVSSKTAMSSVAQLLARNQAVRAKLPEAKVQTQTPINGYLEFLKANNL